MSVTAFAGALLMISAAPIAADEVRDGQWPLKKLEAEALRGESAGDGQIVAVIDNGVDPEHPDLVGNVLDGKDFVDGGEATPENGDVHGTGVASVIVGHGHGPGGTEGVVGLAPEADVLPIRDQGHGMDGYAESIRYAVDHGASVINISQGTARPQARYEEDAAIAYALDRGVVVIAASGNGEGKVGYPASYPGVVAVGASTASGEAWENSDAGPQILLNAPGVEIPHAGGPQDPKGYGLANGTSYATAYVSAAAALLQAEFPDLTAGQIVNRLTETAELPASAEGAQVPDPQYGYGIIRPLAALTEDIPKGSEYGPLRVPEATKAAQEKKERLAESAEMQKQADRKAIIAWSVIGGVGLLLVALVVLLVVRRRRKRNRPGGPGGPPGPGYPYQGQPYPQQAPPQYTSYGTPPPGAYPPAPPQGPPRG